MRHPRLDGGSLQAEGAQMQVASRLLVYTTSREAFSWVDSGPGAAEGLFHHLLLNHPRPQQPKGPGDLPG